MTDPDLVETLARRLHERGSLTPWAILSDRERVHVRGIDGGCS